MAGYSGTPLPKKLGITEGNASRCARHRTDSPTRWASDITEDVVRHELLPSGWVDNKVCAIDDTWSGLRFALRRELR